MRAPDRHSSDRFTLAVLNHVLGGGLSSRLFQEIRESRGLAYAIGSDRSAFDDAGTLAISVGTSPDKAHEVLDLLHTELDRFAAKGISQRELEVAKGHLRADMLLSLEDSGSRMSRIGSATAAVRHGAHDRGAPRPHRGGDGRAGPDRRRAAAHVAQDPGRGGALLGGRLLVKKVAVLGAAGRMGIAVSAAVLAAPDMELVAAVDPAAGGRLVADVAGVREGGLRISGTSTR